MRYVAPCTRTAGSTRRRWMDERDTVRCSACGEPVAAGAASCAACGASITSSANGSGRGREASSEPAQAEFGFGVAPDASRFGIPPEPAPVDDLPPLPPPPPVGAELPSASDDDEMNSFVLPPPPAPGALWP